MATPVLQGADIRASNIIGSTITATTLNVPTLSVNNLTVPGTITGGTITSGGTITGNAIVSTTSVTAASVAATGAVTAASVTATGTVTGQKVVGTFGTTSGLPLPVAPIWTESAALSIDAYVVGDIVVANIGGGIFKAFQCAVAQPVGSANPSTLPADWTELAAPFTSNLQMGTVLFQATSMVVGTDYSVGVYVPGMAVGVPVFVTPAYPGVAEALIFSASAAGGPDAFTINVALNGVAPTNTLVHWFAPIATA